MVFFFLLVQVPVELVVRGEHHNGPEANGQREEALSNGIVPDTRYQEHLPIGSNQIENTIPRTVQSQSSQEQTNHYDIRKKSQEVSCSPGTLHTTNNHHEYRQPAEQRAYRQTPVWSAYPIVDIVFFV